MTTVSAPAWAPWTSYYDSAGQAPGMVTNVAGDNLSVQFMLDRLTLSLQGGQYAPFAGAAGLSGALSVNVPPDFSMLDRARHAIPVMAARHTLPEPGPGNRLRLQPGMLHQRLQPRHGRGTSLPSAPALPRHLEHAGPPPDSRRSHRHQHHRHHRHPDRVTAQSVASSNSKLTPSSPHRRRHQIIITRRRPGCHQCQHVAAGTSRNPALAATSPCCSPGARAPRP